MTDETKPTGDASKPAAPVAKPGIPAAKSSAAAARPKPKPKPPPEPPKGPTDPAPPEDMEVPAFVTAVQAGVPGAVERVSYWVGDWTVIVPADRLIEVARFLRDDPTTAFNYCSDVTAVDWPPRAQRFDVVYCLYSVSLRHRIRIKVRASEGEERLSCSGL